MLILSISLFATIPTGSIITPARIIPTPLILTKKSGVPIRAGIMVNIITDRADKTRVRGSHLWMYTCSFDFTLKPWTLESLGEDEKSRPTPRNAIKNIITIVE